MGGYYSFRVYSSCEVEIVENFVFIDEGMNTFNCHVNSIDAFVERLKAAGVRIDAMYHLDAPEAPDEEREDFLLPGMNSRPPIEKQKASVLALAKVRAPRPLLIGEAAVHLGWWATLNETEAMLEEMVRENSLRRPTAAELRVYGLRFGYLPV